LLRLCRTTLFPYTTLFRSEQTKTSTITKKCCAICEIGYKIKHHATHQYPSSLFLTLVSSLSKFICFYLVNARIISFSIRVCHPHLYHFPRLYTSIFFQKFKSQSDHWNGDRYYYIVCL